MHVTAQFPTSNEHVTLLVPAALCTSHHSISLGTTSKSDTGTKPSDDVKYAKKIHFVVVLNYWH